MQFSSPSYLCCEYKCSQFLSRGESQENARFLVVPNSFMLHSNSFNKMMNSSHIYFPFKIGALSGVVGTAAILQSRIILATAHIALYFQLTIFVDLQNCPSLSDIVYLITQNRVMNFVYWCYEFFVSTVSFSVNGPSLCCEKQKKIVTRP